MVFSDTCFALIIYEDFRFVSMEELQNVACQKPNVADVLYYQLFFEVIVAQIRTSSRFQNKNVP